jgi:hypothetical protein
MTHLRERTHAGAGITLRRGMLSAFVPQPSLFNIVMCPRPLLRFSDFFQSRVDVADRPHPWPPQSPPACTRSLRAPSSPRLAASISAGTSRCGGSGSKGTEGNIISASRMSVAIFMVSSWRILSGGGLTQTIGQMGSLQAGSDAGQAYLPLGFLHWTPKRALTLCDYPVDVKKRTEHFRGLSEGSRRRAT